MGAKTHLLSPNQLLSREQLPLLDHNQYDNDRYGSNMGATNGSLPCWSLSSGEHCSHPPVEPKPLVELPPPTINENDNDTDDKSWEWEKNPHCPCQESPAPSGSLPPTCWVEPKPVVEQLPPPTANPPNLTPPLSTPSPCNSYFDESWNFNFYMVSSCSISNLIPPLSTPSPSPCDDDGDPVKAAIIVYHECYLWYHIILKTHLFERALL